jgi:hypothetical protein
MVQVDETKQSSLCSMAVGDPLRPSRGVPEARRFGVFCSADTTAAVATYLDVAAKAKDEAARSRRIGLIIRRRRGKKGRWDHYLRLDCCLYNNACGCWIVQRVWIILVMVDHWWLIPRRGGVRLRGTDFGLGESPTWQPQSCISVGGSVILLCWISCHSASMVAVVIKC